MSPYTAPVTDTMFVLTEIVGLENLSGPDAAIAPDADFIAAVLEQAGRFASNVLAPLNAPGDREGCRWVDGAVTTPQGFKQAFDRYVADGWPALTAPEQFGGQGLPRAIWLAVEEYGVAANLSFVCYNVLSVGAVNTLVANASEEIQARFVPPLVSGRWTGTMNLTEPHCGTDLSLIRTTGTRRADGSYGVSGTKIFITSGEHDLAENIVHLVLARTAGAPDGLRGLSLFVVPKFLTDADGVPSARNGVTCGSIEHKMGLRASATCVMHYEDANGFLVGEEGSGLAAMFVMVNMARLHVGVQGLGLAAAAYQHAARYARERRQGRAPTGPADPAHRADPLIVHPDVRRMLMECRALIEGCRALCLWTSAQIDIGERAADPAQRALARDLAALLTPVAKGFVTDIAYRCATTSQQVFGGHGYIQETGIEQFVRDARVTMLYEGSNGIQALDLATRKIFARNGETLRAFMALVRVDADAVGERFPELSTRLRALADETDAATRWLAERAVAAPDDAAAGAYSYMELVGHLALGWLWARMALAAAIRGEAGQDADFCRAKIATARFYFEHLMPAAMTLRARIESGAHAVMALDEMDF